MEKLPNMKQFQPKFETKHGVLLLLIVMTTVFVSPENFVTCIEVCAFLYAYGVLFLKIEANQSVRGVSLKMAAIQAFAVSLGVPYWAMTPFTIMKLACWIGLFAIMLLRHRSTIDWELDNLTLHLAWPMIIPIAIYSFAGEKLWLFPAFVAYWLFLVSNVYQTYHTYKKFSILAI